MNFKLLIVFKMTQVNKQEMEAKWKESEELHAFDDWVYDTPGMSHNENIGMYMWKLVDKGYPLDFVWYNVEKWHETKSGEGIHIHFNDSEDHKPYHIIENWKNSKSGKWREQMEKRRLTKKTVHNCDEFPPEIMLGVIGPNGMMGVINQKGEKMVYRSRWTHMDEFMSLLDYHSGSELWTQIH